MAPLKPKQLKELSEAEARLAFALKSVRALRRRAHPPGEPVPKAVLASPVGGAAVAALASNQSEIYKQLLGLFASDGKPVDEVDLDTVLEKDPLGYDTPSLADFYSYKINPWFKPSPKITTAAVPTSKTVEDLVVKIDTNGGKPR